MTPVKNNTPEPNAANITLWVRENFLGEYSIEIAEGNEIIIRGSCTLANSDLEELPYKFKAVYGNFFIGGHSMDNTGLPNSYKLKSLKNCPDLVTGNFRCQLCPDLKSLKEGPVKVDGTYKCSHCDLRNLEGVATEIGKYLIAYCNPKLDDISELRKCKFLKADFEYCADSLYETDDYFDMCVEDKILYPVPD